jgi:hypothetical protein
MKAILAAVVLALAAAFARSEDAGAKAAPVPAEQKEPKQEAAAATSSTQALPTFPIQSDEFNAIHDGMEDEDEDDNTAAKHYNPYAVLDVIPALRASTPQHLAANVDKQGSYTFAGFKKLFNHPVQFRGHVVQFDGTVKFLYEKPSVLTENGNNIELARGLVSTSYQPVSFLSLAPLPAKLKVGDSVRVTGIFVQRFAYINQEMPGLKLTWTPLIVIQKLEPIEIKEEPPTSMAWFIGYIVFGMVAVALVLTRLSSKRGMVERSNVFRRMRIQREGKDRAFPRAKK